MEITEDEIHRAIDFLAYKAPEKMAFAKENRIVKENTIKAVKSELFLNESGPVAQREAKALSDNQYLDAVTHYAEAAREEEQIKLEIAAANMKIEIWRTQSSNQRSMKI